MILKNLILRNTPEIADIFELRTIEPVDGKNTFEVFCENDKIVICGDCKISQEGLDEPNSASACLACAVNTAGAVGEMCR